MKTTASWAPSKGKGPTAGRSEIPPKEPDTNPFKMLFDGDQVSEEVLEELAEALDFQSAAAMAKRFAGMGREEQGKFMAKAKEIVERI